jgi:hypothetical protein
MITTKTTTTTRIPSVHLEVGIGVPKPRDAPGGPAEAKSPPGVQVLVNGRCVSTVFHSLNMLIFHRKKTVLESA